MKNNSTSQNQYNSLPKGWIWTILEEIANINPKFKGDSLDDDMDVSFLPMKAVEERTGKIDLSRIKKISEVKKGYTPFRNSDILFAKITPCMENGKVAIVNNLKNGIGFGSTEFHVVRISDTIDKRLLFFFLLQDDYRKTAQRSMTGSAGQLRVPAYFIKKTLFPLPPLPEQHRIVVKIEELFTRLDAGVEALKKIKVQLKRYRQAVLKYAFEGKLTEEWREKHKGEIEPAGVLLERIRQETSLQGAERRSKLKRSKDEIASPLARNDSLPELLEGWVWTKVGMISEMIQYGTSEKANEGSQGIPVLRMGNIQDGKLIFEYLKYFPKSWSQLYDFLLKDGDVLFNRTNSAELVGKTAVYKNYHRPAVFASYLIRVKVNKNAYAPDLLAFYINSFYGRKYIASVVSQQVGQANVNGTKLSLMLIPLPPLPEQNKIVEEIERRFSVADEVEKTVDQSLKQAERLRQSILKKAFEGKLVPQDPSDEPAEKLLERIKAEKAKLSDEYEIKSKRRKSYEQKTSGMV